jgi:CelD/BcsL family acetyltransferase involved in cellulose biosynthesis
MRLPDAQTESLPSLPPKVVGGEVLLTGPADLEVIESVWRRLWAASCPAPPMLEFRWIQRWWRLQRTAGSLQLLLVLDQQQRPLGLAPLYLRQEGVRHLDRCLRTVHFLGTGEPERDEVAGEYTSWLGPSDAAEVVSERVLVRLAAGGWDRVLLRQMWPDGGIAEHLARGLAGQALHTEITREPSFRAATQPLEAYIAALPSANFRNRCRRAVRAGKELGVGFVRADSAAEVQEMFAALQRLHQRRWHKRGQAGVFASPVFTTFQRSLLDEYARTGRMWLVGLRQGDRWLAVRYLLRAGNRLYDYVSGVDTDTHTALAPGLLLHLLTIDACAATGIEVYDLMAGESDYKRHLAVEETGLPTLDVFARTLRSRLWLAARNLRRRIRSRAEPVEAAEEATPAPSRQPAPSKGPATTV